MIMRLSGGGINFPAVGVSEKVNKMLGRVTNPTFPRRQALCLMKALSPCFRSIV